MDSKICTILFGIISFVVAKPKSDESPLIITNESDLQQLLKTLYNDGKFDIAFSHHEDGPKSHHQDITRISHHNEHSHHRHREDTHYREHKKHHESRTHSDNNGLPRFTNIGNLNLFLRKKLKNADGTYDYEETEDLPRLKSEEDAKNVDQVVNLLNALENKLDSENQCVGDTCASGRSVDGYDDNIERSNNNNDNLLCFGDECGRDDVYIEERADCAGELCGLRNDDDNGGYNRDDDNDNDDKNIARCFGNSCGIDQTSLRERRLPNGDPETASLFQSQARKIKISDDLDALVLNLSDVEKYLENSRAKERNENERSKLQLFRDVDISNIIVVNNDDDEESIRDQNALESKPIKAVVVDLSKTQNDLTNQINQLMRNIQTPLKQYKSNKVSNIRDNILSRGEPKILPHDEPNNNVYVPKWLLHEIVTKNNLRDSDAKTKKLFPLTLKQKAKLAKAKAKVEKQKQKSQRIFRRSINDDIGVPFHLQIEGLSQLES